MPGPFLAAPTLFALATGALIGAGVAALIYEPQLIDDVKQTIKEGVDAFLEKRRRRENGYQMREMSQAAPTPNESSSSRSGSHANPFEDTFDDLYHTPTFGSTQKLNFGSSSDSDDSSDNSESRLTRRRGQRKGTNSLESFSSGSARVSKRFKAPSSEKIVLFGNTVSSSTDEAETESSTTSDAGFTTPADEEAAMVSTAESESNFSDPVIIEFTSEEEESDMEPSSVSTLKQSGRLQTN